MMVAVIRDLPGATAAQPATAWGTLDATPQGGHPIQVARSIATDWRDLEAWESPDVIEAFIRSTAGFVAAAADGDPTWEDAAWQ
jgi:hypothetical protein